MKKIFFICFTLLASTLLFCACHSESMDDIVKTKGELNLSSLKVGVDMNVDVVYLQESRAASEVDLSNYIVTLYDGYSQQVGQWVYSEMPEIVSLAVGTYTVDVKSAAEPSSGFDTPYYEGTTTCEVKENEVANVPEISCKLANMLFTIEYEAFQDKLEEDVVTTISIGENALQIPVTETRQAYLAAPEDESASLVVHLKGTIDGEPIDESTHFDNVKSGVHNIIKYQFIPVSNGAVAGGAFNILIAVDSSLTASDETVSVNPGAEPGIDDFPTGGGEGGDAPVIVGTNFNGRPFDISNEVLKVPGSVNVDNPWPLQVTLSAANGIAHVYVTIDSGTLTEEVLDGVGLAASFDLAEPGELEAGLEGLGFPTGENVVGQPEILFDVTPFTGLLGIYGPASHNFIIRLVDQQGLEVTQTLKIESVE